MEATTFRMYNWKERSWVLLPTQTNTLLRIFKNTGEHAGTTDREPHRLTKISKVADLCHYLLLGLLLATIQMELKCYCFGSALNCHHCCRSFPIQLTSTSLKHLFSLYFYLLIVFHIPSIYKLFHTLPSLECRNEQRHVWKWHLLTPWLLIYIDWIISQFQLSAIFLFSAQLVEPALRVAQW